jgi:hypothetical protein
MDMVKQWMSIEYQKDYSRRKIVEENPRTDYVHTINRLR